MDYSKIKRHPPTMITLDGRLERITYQNNENHYTIARFCPENSYRQITIVGYLPGVIPEQSLRLRGQWKTHAKYGQQFAVESFKESLPADIAGIRKYLMSGILRGIGPRLAQGIIDHFGAETLAVIENHPEKLMSVEGIGETKAASIAEAWKTHHLMRKLMSILQSNGLKASYASKIIKIYGEEAVEIITQDPFQMAADLPDIGFPIADRITQNQGFAKDDEKRIRACLLFLLQQNVHEGHSYTDLSALIERCQRHFDIESQQVTEMLQCLSDSNETVLEANPADSSSQAVYLKALYQAETGIAQRIHALLSVPDTFRPPEKEAILETTVQKLAIKLSDEQLAILENVFTNRVAIITGGPGTGKTTLIRSINAVYASQGLKVALAAPTGRAARQLASATGKNAYTIHRLLGYNWKEDCFERNQDNPIDADVVIVDEASMVDIHVMFHLLKAIPITSDLIIVGDVFQLPSVGPGNVLADLIHSGIIPLFRLSHVFRQAEESQIVMNAHAVRQGEMLAFNPPIDDDQAMEIEEGHLDGLWGKDPMSREFHYIPQTNPKKTAGIILQLCCHQLQTNFKLDPIRDVQVITPMHKGDAGTVNLNQMLQKALNPQAAPFTNTGSRFHQGDKVMHLVNNYQKEVFNGDIGIVQSLDSELNTLVVEYDGRCVNYACNELDELSLAYAITVHKSQGSEYPAVVMPLLTQHYMLLQRNLLYTAITRAQKYVFLIGNPKAIKMAVGNDQPRSRLSGLAVRLNSFE